MSLLISKFKYYLTDWKRKLPNTSAANLNYIYAYNFQFQVEVNELRVIQREMSAVELSYDRNRYEILLFMNLGSSLQVYGVSKKKPTSVGWIINHHIPAAEWEISVFHVCYSKWYLFLLAVSPILFRWFALWGLLYFQMVKMANNEWRPSLFIIIIMSKKLKNYKFYPDVQIAQLFKSCSAELVLTFRYVLITSLLVFRNEYTKSHWHS